MEKMIHALTFDTAQDGWETSKGFMKRTLAQPTLDLARPEDAASVIIKIIYAGVCGSDRGIYARAAFRDMIHSSLETEGKTLRVLGHEFFGEIVEAGANVKNVSVGQTVSGDSHVTCGECYQCKIGEEEVCQNQSILGISIDGIYAEYVKVPAKNLWVVDGEKIRPEIAAMMDPIGNAVHALSKVNVKDASIAIFGTGQIGLFSILVALTQGAKQIIAIDTNPANLEMARQLGAHETILIERSEKAHDYDIDAVIVEEIKRLTNGVGVDVSMEMAGFNSSVNNCIGSTRFGGSVILFGIKDGDFVIPNFSQMIVRGLNVYNVIGRQIFETWETTNNILADVGNGVQDKIWNVILNKGEGTVIKLSEYDAADFEQRMNEHPKLVFDIQN